MGNSTSEPTLHVRFVPQDQPVAVIDPRFCDPRVITLQKKSEFFKSGYTFQDLSTNATRFTVKGGAFARWRTLLDASETLVVTYKSFSMKPRTHVHAGATHDGEPLLQFYAKYHSGEKTKVKIEFDDLLTKVRCELGFTGHWRRRNGYYWLAKGPSGVHEPVAKIHCPVGVSRSKYHLEIVPNMDAALLVLICSVLGRLQTNDESV